MRVSQGLAEGVSLPAFLGCIVPELVGLLSFCTVPGVGGFDRQVVAFTASFVREPKGAALWCLSQVATGHFVTGFVPVFTWCCPGVRGAST